MTRPRSDSRRSFVKTFSSIVVMILAAAAAGAAAQAPAPAARSTAVADGVYVIENLGDSGNVAFVVGRDATAVIDAGTVPAHGAAILAQVRAVTDRPVRYVILTQYHGDHTFGLQTFEPGTVILGKSRMPVNMKARYSDYAAQGAAEVDAARKEAARLKALPGSEAAAAKAAAGLAALEAQLAAMKDLRIVPPNVTFDGPVTIDLGGRTVEILDPGPAHTDDSAVVLVPDARVIHMGDLVFAGSHPYIDAGAGANTRRWIEFLRETEARDVVRVIPGHGPVSGKDVLETQARYLEALRAEVGAALDRGLGAEQTAKAVRMEAYPGYGYAEILPVIAQAVYRELEAERKAGTAEK